VRGESKSREKKEDNIGKDLLGIREEISMNENKIKTKSTSPEIGEVITSDRKHKKACVSWIETE